MTKLVCGHESEGGPLDWAPEGSPRVLTFWCPVCNEQRSPAKGFKLRYNIDGSVDLLVTQEALWRAHKDTCNVCGVWELGPIGDGPPKCERGAVIFAKIKLLRRRSLSSVSIRSGTGVGSPRLPSDTVRSMTSESASDEDGYQHQHLCPDHGWETCTRGDPMAYLHACTEGDKNLRGVRLIEYRLMVRVRPRIDSSRNQSPAEGQTEAGVAGRNPVAGGARPMTSGDPRAEGLQLFEGSTLADIWRWVEEFKDRWTPGWREEGGLKYALGAASETGEMIDIWKHRMDGGSQRVEFPPDALAEESFDGMVYLIAMLVTEGWTYERFMEVARRKAAVVQRRFEDRAAGGTGQIKLHQETV